MKQLSLQLELTVKSAPYLEESQAPADDASTRKQLWRDSVVNKSATFDCCQVVGMKLTE